MTLVDGRDHLEDDRLKRHLEDGRCHLHLGQRREIESKVAPFLKDRQKHADEAAEEYKLAKDEFKAVIKNIMRLIKRNYLLGKIVIILLTFLWHIMNSDIFISLKNLTFLQKKIAKSLFGH